MTRYIGFIKNLVYIGQRANSALKQLKNQFYQLQIPEKSALIKTE